MAEALAASQIAQSAADIAKTHTGEILAEAAAKGYEEQTAFVRKSLGKSAETLYNDSGNILDSTLNLPRRVVESISKTGVEAVKGIKDISREIGGGFSSKRQRVIFIIYVIVLIALIILIAAAIINKYAGFENKYFLKADKYIDYLTIAAAIFSTAGVFYFAKKVPRPAFLL